MDRRLAATGRIGMVLVVGLLLAHFATGASMVHGLAGHHGEHAERAGDVAPPIPTQPAAVACGDGGACALADRLPSPLDLTPAPAVMVVLAVLWSAVVVSMGRRLLLAYGPAPPPHLSAQVVLVI